MGSLLFIIASFLKWALTPLLYGYGFVRSLTKYEVEKWHKELAIAKDCYGNVLGQHLFNDFFIKFAGYKFGKRKETISSVLGKNERDKTLLFLGKITANTLNAIEKEHCKKAIDNNV